MSGGRFGFRRLFHLGLWGPDPDRGVDWEIEHHIQERADELEAEGLGREAAVREARRQFGDVAAVRRELRAVDRAVDRRRRFAVLLETVWQDVRYGARGIARSAGFSTVLVLTLGLGIGATVAVFGLVDALLLRPLPYAAPEELVRITVVSGERSFGQRHLPWEVVREWRERDVAFAGMLPHRRNTVLYTGGVEPRDIIAHRVGESFEEVLGVHPVLGRGFLPEDAAPGAPPVALVSHEFWRGELGGAADAVGRPVLLDDVAHTVIGVMPPGFKFPEYASTASWVPLGGDDTAAAGRVELLGRVRDAAFEAATARANALARGLFENRPGAESVSIELSPMEAERGGRAEIRKSSWLLLGAVGLILLVAVLNGANLLLVRGARRAREIGVRVALGASRWRLVRQLLTETLGLALLGGALAVVVAFLSLRGIQGLLPRSLAFWLPHAVGLERRALVVAFLLAAGTGVLLGLLPALRSTRRDRTAARGDLTPYAASTPGRSRLRRGLVVAEVAFSVMLLVGAGLLLNSFVRLTAVDVGVRTERLALLNLYISDRAQPDSAARSGFLTGLEERVRAMPGVVAATATGRLPGNYITFGTALQAEGRPPAGGDPLILPWTEVSPEFFEVLGARLLAGRSFQPHETPDDRVAIVDEDLVRHLWPDGSAVGRRFRIDSTAPWLTVVGVVADLQLEGRDDREGDFEVLHPFDPTTATGAVTLAFRTAGDPRALFPAVRAAVHELAPTQPIEELVPAETAYAEAIDLPRFLAVLVTALGAFSLVLAGIGMFGVLAYEVAQRTREMGIRMAMGARSRSLRAMVVREGVVVAAIGSAIGLAVGAVLSRLLRAFLFGVDPTDPGTLTAVLVTALATAALASYFPALRATRVDPAEVMRAE